MEKTHVTLNISGRRFELSIKTIARIPFIDNMLKDCGWPEGEIRIERSPQLFEEVLKVVYDPEYRVSRDCWRELDFYLVEYDNTRLCAQELALERNYITSVNAYIGTIGDVNCSKSNCSRTARIYASTCSSCKDYCIVKDCREKTQNNVCLLHENIICCHHKPCRCFPLPNQKYCGYHLSFMK
jgi:hypothetical protein